MKKKSSIISLALLLAMLLSLPAMAASAGKGMLVRDVQLSKTEGKNQDEWKSYDFSACPKQ